MLARVKHDVMRPKLKCSVCVTGKEGEEPPLCAFQRCEAAHLMNPGFEPWLLMFRLLRSDVLSKNGLNARTLEENDWSDLGSQLIFAQMDIEHHNAVNEVREREIEAERLKRLAKK